MNLVNRTGFGENLTMVRLKKMTPSIYNIILTQICQHSMKMTFCFFLGFLYICLVTARKRLCERSHLKNSCVSACHLSIYLSIYIYIYIYIYVCMYRYNLQTPLFKTEDSLLNSNIN